MKLLLCCLMLSSLVSLARADVDVTGKWSGTLKISVPGEETHDSPAWLDLKQDGGSISGTAGPNESEQQPIAKGTVEGDRIHLEVQHNEVTIRFDLVLADGRLKGDADLSRAGESAKGKLDVGRVK